MTNPFLFNQSRRSSFYEKRLAATDTRTRHAHHRMRSSENAGIKSEKLREKQQTVCVQSPEGDPDFRDAGSSVRLDVGHVDVWLREDRRVPPTSAQRLSQ